VERKGEFMVVMEVESYHVQPDRAFMNRVEQLCGRGSVRRVDYRGNREQSRQG
jgi:hypothetical protein